MPLRVQFARQPISPVLLNRLIQLMPRHVLQQTTKYAILVQHGVALLPCLERLRSAQNTEESTSCTPSTKIEPDSRGTRPGMTARFERAGHARASLRPCSGTRASAAPFTLAGLGNLRGSYASVGRHACARGGVSASGGKCGLA